MQEDRKIYYQLVTNRDCKHCSSGSCEYIFFSIDENGALNIEKDCRPFIKHTNLEKISKGRLDEMVKQEDEDESEEEYYKKNHKKSEGFEIIF